MYWSDHLARLRDSLVAQVARIRDANDHGTTIGNCVETVLRRTIADYMPKYFAVESGQVCNLNQQLSPQIDILIHDRSCFPPLSVNEDGSVIVCAEPTKSVVECKTQWKPDEIATHYRNFTSVQSYRGRNNFFDGPETVAGYFVFIVDNCPIEIPPEMSDANRFVGIYSLNTSNSQRSKIGETIFTRETNENSLERFLRDLLFDCMQKGQTEGGTFEETFKIVQRYMG